MLSLSGNGDISHNGDGDDCDSEAQFAWNLMVGMVREWKLFSQLPRRCHSVACLVLPHLRSHPRSSHRCLQHGLIQGDNHHPSKTIIIHATFAFGFIFTHVLISILLIGVFNPVSFSSILKYFSFFSFLALTSPEALSMGSAHWRPRY